MSEHLAAPQSASDNQAFKKRSVIGVYASRVIALWVAELQRLRHDRTELYTRAVQPALWLIFFGATFSQIRGIPTGDVPYLDYLMPGILTQSVLFISIFYGITIVWERDAGALSKLLVTPTPRTAIVAGKAFAASARAITQAVIVVVISVLMGVAVTANPLELLGALVVVTLSAVCFSCLSIALAGILLKRERLMGLGQAISLPLFFASNALYPVSLMPTWLQWVSKFNPLTYQVNALRNLLLGTPGNLWLDFAIVGGAALGGILVASALIGRLSR